MFDIGFQELVLVGIVALLVIGPERLPAVARTIGTWVGRFRRFAATVQSDFNQEIAKSEELKRLIEEQSRIKDLHEIIEQTVDETRRTVSVKASVNDYVVKAIPEPEADMPGPKVVPDKAQGSVNEQAK